MFGKGLPEDPDAEMDVNEQLEQVEQNVRRRLAKEDQTKSTSDPVRQVMEKIGVEKKMIAQLEEDLPQVL